MSETYNITLDSQLGERLGTLTLDGSGRSVSGIISLLGFDNAVSGIYEAGVLYLKHELHTLVASHKCSSVIRLNDGTLSGTVRTGRAAMQLRGTRISPDTEDNK